MKGINIFLADGFEDVEALGTNDVLRRGGLQTRLVSVSDEPFVTSSHGVMVGPDCLLSDLAEGEEETTKDDIMIFPGGMPGTKHLAECRTLTSLMQKHYAAGGSLAAICAAPGLVLSKMGEALPKGFEFTCFDGFEKYLTDMGATFKPQGTVRCGRIITGRSAGYALCFGLEILSYLKGSDAADKTRHSMYLQ